MKRYALSLSRHDSRVTKRQEEAMRVSTFIMRYLSMMPLTPNAVDPELARRNSKIGTSSSRNLRCDGYWLVWTISTSIVRDVRHQDTNLRRLQQAVCNAAPPHLAMHVHHHDVCQRNGWRSSDRMILECPRLRRFVFSNSVHESSALLLTNSSCQQIASWSAHVWARPPAVRKCLPTAVCVNRSLERRI